jgi:hypothetical protein
MSNPLERWWWLAAAVAAVVVGVATLGIGGLETEARAAVCGVGAGLLVARGFLLSGSTKRAIATLLLAAWAGGIVGWMVARPADRLATRHEVRDWSWYHYYLGSKYFEELGYRGLYDQTVAVDVENEERFVGIKDLRDLRTYRREPMNYRQRVRSDNWEHTRWRDFTADVLWFQDRFKLKDWKRVLRDRGYNATPTGHWLYSKVSRAPLSPQVLAVVGFLDPLLLLLALIAAGRVFGGFKALLAGAWFLIFYGNEFHVFGGPLLYDFAAATIAAAAALKSDRPRLAGGLLGWAAMGRVFPGFLLIGLVIWAVARKQRQMPIRLLQGVAAVCALGFLIGCASPRGVSAWTDWSENMQMHSRFHRFGNSRIGLQHPFTHDVTTGTDWRLKEWRHRTWPKQKGAWMVTALALGLLFVVAVARGVEDPLEAMVLSLAVVFAGIVLSRYYWTVACLLFLLGGRERDGPREGLLAGGLFALIALFYAYASVESRSFGQYVLANAAWLVFWAVLLASRLRRPATQQADAILPA